MYILEGIFIVILIVENRIRIGFLLISNGIVWFENVLGIFKRFMVINLGFIRLEVFSLF